MFIFNRDKNTDAYGVEDIPDVVMKCRFKRFVEVYGLDERYGTLASGELGAVRAQCVKLVDVGGVGALKDYFVELCSSAEADNLNSWLSALYRAAVRQVEEIADRLGQA